MPPERVQRSGAARLAVALGALALLALGLWMLGDRGRAHGSLAPAGSGTVGNATPGANPAPPASAPVDLATSSTAEPSPGLAPVGRPEEQRRSVDASASASLDVSLQLSCTPIEPLRFALHHADGGARPLEQLSSSGARWEGLDPGAWTLTVAGDGWPTVRRELRLAPGTREEAVVLAPLTFLRGQVLDETTGRPVRTYELKLEHQLPRNLTLAHRRVRIADDEGRFALGGLPEDGLRMRILASAEGYLTVAGDWLPVAPRIEGLVLLLRDAAGTLARLRGTLRRPEGGADTPGSVELLVVAADADPARATVAGGRLRVPASLRVGREPDDLGTALTHRGAAAGSGRALARGNAYRLSVRAAGPARVLAHSAFGVAASEVVHLVPGQEVVVPPIDLAPRHATATVSGRVIAPGGPWLVRVMLYGEGLSRTHHELGEQGTFHFAALPAGTYDVAARGVLEEPDGTARDLLLATARVTLVAGEERRLELDAGGAGGASVAGIVVSPDEAIGRWQLALVPLDADTARGAPVAGDGSFRFDGVAGGEYLLALGSVPEPHGALALAFVPVAVADDASSWVELRPGGGVELVAPRRGDEAVFTFTLAPEDPRLARLLADQGHLGLFDAQGTARVHGLPPGRVTFRCGERTLATRLPLPPGTRLARWD